MVNRLDVIYISENPKPPGFYLYQKNWEFNLKVEDRYDCVSYTAMEFNSAVRALLIVIAEDPGPENLSQLKNSLGGSYKEKLSTPLVVIDALAGTMRDQNTGSFDSLSARLSLSDIIYRTLRLANRHIPPVCPNSFGVMTPFELALTVSQLQSVYAINLPTAGNFGTPDPSQTTGSQALRLRLLPAEFIQNEFDLVLAEISTLPNLDRRADYKQILKRVRALLPEEAKTLINQAENSRVGRGYVSLGDNIHGFAIDPVSLEFAISYKSGRHGSIKSALGYQAICVSSLRFEDVGPQKRFISALIYAAVPGLDIPLLVFDEFPDSPESAEDYQKVGSFIISQQRFIPIDQNGRIVGD